MLDQSNKRLIAEFAIGEALSVHKWESFWVLPLYSGRNSGLPEQTTLIGATVADFRGEFRAVRGRGEMALACLLRLGVLPVLFLLLAKYLPCSIELKRVIVLEAAMPAAVFPIVIAKHYGGDTATALRVVISTSVVGLITIPLWIRFGMNWVGL
jgi:predicted permease